MKRTALDIICEIFHAHDQNVDDGLDLRNLPAWDSLNHMNFIAAIENEFKILLTGDEIADMLSLKNVNRILQENHGLEI